MTPEWYQWLGLAAFAVIAVFIVLAVAWRVWYAVDSRMIQKRTIEFETAQTDRPADLPRGFGYKIAWLAIRSQEPEAVRDTLGSHGDTRQADWAEGIQQAYSSDWVFVTPSVDGWVFVVGWGVWPDDPRGLKQLLLPLSQTFGEVQAFASHRVSSAYAWVKVLEGKMVRWFDLGDGDIVANEGEPTDIENKLTSKWDDPEELPLEIDEESVIAVADAWSIDPGTLDERDDPRENGWLCRMSK